jgi:hypothetical protein
MFVSGPLWGLRLDYEKGEQLQLIQIILPVFVSYLSAAVTYAIAGKTFPEPDGERGKILRVITVGSFVIFLITLGLATAIYYYSADGTLQHGRLEFDKYRSVITSALSLLAATTSAITTFLFMGRK